MFYDFKKKKKPVSKKKKTFNSHALFSLNPSTQLETHEGRKGTNKISKCSHHHHRLSSDLFHSSKPQQDLDLHVRMCTFSKLELFGFIFKSIQLISINHSSSNKTF